MVLLCFVLLISAEGYSYISTDTGNNGGEFQENYIKTQYFVLFWVGNR